MNTTQKRSNQEFTTVDNFLEKQDEIDHLVLVSRIEGDEENVQVAPYVAGTDCQCHQRIKVRKCDIEKIADLGQIENCCGDTFRVASVTFADEAQVPLSELFKLGSGTPSKASLHHFSEQYEVLPNHFGIEQSGAVMDPNVIDPHDKPYFPYNPWYIPTSTKCINGKQFRCFNPGTRDERCYETNVHCITEPLVTWSKSYFPKPPKLPFPRFPW